MQSTEQSYAVTLNTHHIWGADKTTASTIEQFFFNKTLAKTNIFVFVLCTNCITSNKMGIFCRLLRELCMNARTQVLWAVMSVDWQTRGKSRHRTLESSEAMLLQMIPISVLVYSKTICSCTQNKYIVLQSCSITKQSDLIRAMWFSSYRQVFYCKQNNI